MAALPKVSKMDPTHGFGETGTQVEGVFVVEHDGHNSDTFYLMRDDEQARKFILQRTGDDVDVEDLEDFGCLIDGNGAEWSIQQGLSFFDSRED